MRGEKFIFSILSLIVLLFTDCTAQNRKINTEKENQDVDRQPVVAGQFYPSDKENLQNMLKDLFGKARPREYKNVKAVIVPHAGYVFSGIIAASGYNQIDRTKAYDNVFIIGSSHRIYFDGASVYSAGNYVTPLGKVKVNVELAKKLIGESDYFSFFPEAEINEHTIEVQVPFLQYILQSDLKIVPVILGTQSPEVCKEIAKVLKPYFDGNNLFVISSDFSHYPSYADAVKIDKNTANAILSNSSLKFLSAINDPTNKNIPNLATRACGWTSILTLLDLTEGQPDLEYGLVAYENSGDSESGDKSKVVGYNAIVVTKKNLSLMTTDFNLTEKDKKDLLDVARATLVQFISDNQVPALNINSFSENLKIPCGAFVTLKKNKELRGCIGRFDANDPLYKVVQQMTIASATQDTRFTPVKQNEISDIEIEISVLSPMQKIDSVAQIKLGIDGIYIKKGNNTGTFLPQVANETGWTLEEFLGHCSRDKAGLGWDGWKDAEIYTYQAIVFNEKEYND